MSARKMAELEGGPQPSLSPSLYSRLRRIAVGYVDGERFDGAIDPTELVHEAWIRLAPASRDQFADQTHFRVVAARTMRRVLIDRARGRGRTKRGSGARRVTLSEAVAGSPEMRVLDSVALAEALDRLGELDGREARIVELRFFGGLNDREIATSLGVSVRTVQSEWAHARAWLRRELTRGSEP